MVEAQLGRDLRGSWSVARRCHLGVPMVIANHPRLDDGTPFPTTFWLTCPLLIKRVASVEGGGRMAYFNEHLSRDASIRTRLREAMDRYIAHRNSLEVIDAEAPGGGPGRAKCLHAHVAHELVSGANPAGSWTLAQTGFPDCREPCYRVDTA